MNAVIARRYLEAQASKAEAPRPAEAKKGHRYDSPQQESNAQFILSKYAPLLQKLAK